MNGPGEKQTRQPGHQLALERASARAPPVYIDGEKGPTLKGERIAEEFQQLVEDYVERTYGRA